jgi:hypothetical protein
MQTSNLEHKAENTEIKCPLISNRVVCNSCGSPNFSIDEQGPRSGNRKKVPGICDDCGHRIGVTTDK